MVIHGHSFGWLSRMTELKTLVIVNMMLKYDSEYAATLRNLESLTLECHGIRYSLCSDELDTFIRALRSLKSIAFILKYTQQWACLDFTHIKESEILTSVSTLENIEMITVKSARGRDREAVHQLLPAVTKIARLKKLKFFSGNLGTGRSDDYIRALSACQSLEELVLDLFLEPESTEGKFVGELDKFPNLKSCYLTFRWYERPGRSPPSIERYGVSSLRRQVKNFHLSVADSGCSDLGYEQKFYRVTFTRKN